MPGAQCTHSLACKNNKTHELVTTGPPGFSPDIPARVGFNRLLRALPGDQVFLTPSPADNSTGLTPTRRRQDHTSSPSATSALVYGAACVHHILPRVRD